MNIIQLKINNKNRALAVVIDNKIINLTSSDNSINSSYKLFEKVINEKLDLNKFLETLLKGSNKFDFTFDKLLESPEEYNVKVLPPIDHPDPYRLFISGTGLTHTGSVKSRDMMHNENDAKKDETDSAKMFQMGIEGGKPSEGELGVAPEWFYKGNGNNLVGHMDSLLMPDFSLDGGEEPEVVGCYFIDNDGNPVRIGFSLGNEFSDHETEKINYLYLAHSKLRNCAIGPSLNTSLEFSDISLSCDISRDGIDLYKSGELKSGEEYMSHSLKNMEYHHFKYEMHRKPGDIHLHFFGTSQLSFSTRDWKFKAGDKVSIYSDQFDGKLENTIEQQSKVNFEIKEV